MGDDFRQTINYFENDIVDQFVNENIIVGDKVYLKADQIHLGTKQIFLNFKGKLLPIYSLLTDVYGIFTPLKDILLMRGLWGDTWICPNPNCGYENYNKVNFCGVCGTKKP